MHSFFYLGLSLLIASVTWSPAQAGGKPEDDDLMYPPADAARPFIDFDGAGFIIDGQRTFWSSGSVHYPRVPHELWQDRLLRLKRANFTGVQTYTFWNFHEPTENRFDFTGDKDFEKFLDTAQALGLYAAVRVGPYVCAEWDSGGYPVWLKFKPPFMVRTNDPAWLAWNDHWYEKILPLVARHQINHGGNVVMVQLENEHPRGWGVITNNPYFVHLSEDAVKWGIQVPYFMSGQHHGPTPAPGNLDSTRRANPWTTTEFWAGWYNVYGALTDQRNLEIETTTWTILAHGGGGYNYYMLHGGTDFDTWNNDEVGASYDDGAAIGQAGDLRPVYYQMKRANQFAESFPGIVANGNDVRDEYTHFVTGPGVQILGARKSKNGAGTFVFIRNSTTNETAAIFPSGERLKLEPAGIYPLPRDVALAGKIRITDSTLPILAVGHNGEVITLAVYGSPGETGRMDLSVDQKDVPLKITIPAQGVAESTVDRPDHFIRILAMSRKVSLYTWLLGVPNRQYIVVGPEFVQSVAETNGSLSVILERPYGQSSCGQVAVFGGRDQSWHLAAKADAALDDMPAPQLGDWKMSSLTEAAPAFDDSSWNHSEIPPPMGADGDISAFAWYRARIAVPAETNGILHFRGGDNLEIFVNGKFVPSQKGTAPVDFQAGTNSLVIFASHHGRNKAYNYLGTLDKFDRKGLWHAPVLQQGEDRQEITGWTMRGGVAADLAGIKQWMDLADTKGMPTFYQTTFDATPPGDLGAHPILRVNYRGLSRGTVWINGHNLGRYPEKINIDSLYIPECWLQAGENILTVFDETGASPRQTALAVETAASREVIRASQSIDPHTPMITP